MTEFRTPLGQSEAMMPSSRQILSGNVVFPSAVLSIILICVWGFPFVWYSGGAKQGKPLWFIEQREIPGWAYAEIPVGEAAQSELGSDSFVNAEFTRPDGTKIRVFSAKTFSESADDVDVFAHNPDRCLPLVGWKLQQIQPEFVVLDLSGKQVMFERRCFQSGPLSELVYFGALVAGEPLPYRLDQYLAFGLRLRESERSGTFLRATDRRFWAYVWHAFQSRRSLKGAKHFIRISTPIPHGDLNAADSLLRGFLNTWLRPGDLRADALKVRRPVP